MEVKDEKRIVGSLDKGLQVMEALMERESMGVTELSRALDVNKTSVYRILTTLAARGFVSQDPTNEKYYLSMKLQQLRIKAMDDVKLRELARPWVEKLTKITNESTGLCVLNGNTGVLIDNCMSSEIITAKLNIGMEEPLHCTSLGKAILSAQPEALRERLIHGTALVAMTSKTIIDEDAFRREIDRAVQEGVAYDDEEYSLGMRCVAAPVFGVAGAPVASIGISGPLSRMTDEAWKEAASKVKSVAKDLSRALAV